MPFIELAEGSGYDESMFLARGPCESMSCLYNKVLYSLISGSQGHRQMVMISVKHQLTLETAQCAKFQSPKVINIA